MQSALSETVWWEAEDAADTVMEAGGKYAPNDEDAGKISGGAWLNGRVEEGLHAEYKIPLSEGGRYTLFARRYWHHGVFRWRLNDGEWNVVDQPWQGRKVVDSVKTSLREPVVWTELGSVELKAGENVLRIEMVGESEYQFNGAFAFDCFVLSNDGFVPSGRREDHDLKNLSSRTGANTPAGPSSPENEAGRHLSRTLELLESSSAENRTPVNILFYGQSIVGQGYADQAIGKYLREKYPHAAVTITNTAIGGYQAPTLRRTAWQDLYNRNPDLVVFHVYGGEGGELEEIFKGMREHLAADVLTWTHHMDNTDDEGNGNREKTSELIRTLAARYGFEVADVRALWKETLAEGGAKTEDFLQDKIHLNARGGALLGEALVSRFKNSPDASQDWKRREKTLAFGEDGLILEGPLRIVLHGNRVDVTALPGGTGSAKILLDGKRPSALRDTLAAGRSGKAPGAWWPLLTHVTLGLDAAAQKYTMRFRDVAPDGSDFAFDVEGSVSGDEGPGRAGQEFVSRSGGVTIKAGDVALATVKRLLGKDLPAEFAVEWEVFSMSRDEWKPSAFPETVERCWTDGPHTLEIIPNGDGPVGIKEIRVFSPSGSPSIEVRK